MATRKVKQGEDGNVRGVETKSTEVNAEALAHASLRPTVQAALTLREYNKLFGDLALPTLVADLGEQCDLASKGDLGRAEAMLIAQAHTLDAIFHKLARKSTHCEYLNQFELNLRLALKAQSQCRATLETLATIKNPQSVAFVKQANIANGPQQVNNGAWEPTTTPESEDQERKGIEAENGKRLELKAAVTASGTDSPLEAVGAIHRAPNAKG